MKNYGAGASLPAAQSHSIYKTLQIDPKKNGNQKLSNEKVFPLIRMFEADHPRFELNNSKVAFLRVSTRFTSNFSRICQRPKFSPDLLNLV